MKKKVLTLALVVALIAIMVSGTLAYFTDNDEVTNTFTIGSVLIEVWENEEPTDEPVVEFRDPLLPIVKVDDPSADESYIEKLVNVKNTGSNAAYIRTYIAIPEALVGFLYLDLSEAGWTRIGDTEAEVDGVKYTVFAWNHDAAVEPGQFTADLLKGVYLGSDVDIKDNPGTTAADLEFCKRDANGGYIFSEYVAHFAGANGYTSNTVSILVYSQAIQAQGFGSAAEALEAGFGLGNPWQ